MKGAHAVGVKVDKTRATTAVLSSAYPWHNAGQLRSVGPVIGVDRLAGDAPFGIDPFRWVNEGVAQNPNIVVAGAPANGKSALVKAMIWWLAGAHGYRFAATDVKGEYRALAEALGVPVIDLRAGGNTRINPLEHPAGRVEFCSALAALLIGRDLRIEEHAVLTAAIRRLPERAEVRDLVTALREPRSLVDDLGMGETAVEAVTRDVRFAFGELLHGAHAGMFDGPSTIDLATADKGLVIDVSGAGRDDMALSLSMLVGTRAIDQMVEREHRPTLVVNDEAWRLTAFGDLVKWLQYSSKIGRQIAQANMMVVHRLAEVGAQADGATAQIASRLVSDADTHILFRQGDTADAADAVARLNLPEACRQFLVQLHPHHCLIRCRDRYAVVRVVLSQRLRTICDTNSAMRGEN